MGYYESILDGRNIDTSLWKCIDDVCNEEASHVDTSVDLSSFRIHDILNPKIWINGLINSRVRLRLLEIADDFVDFLSVDWVKPKDIILTGSLANYNWSKFSDFDLHVLYDFSEVDDRVDFVREYFDSKKNEWNRQHDSVKIYGFPVELYVQDSREPHVSSGVYSLEKNTWLVKPDRDRFRPIQLNKYYIKDKVRTYINKILAIEEMEDGGVEAKRLLSRLKKMRGESLKAEGEMGSGNVIYKCLRRLGYLERLVNAKYESYDKIKSMT